MPEISRFYGIIIRMFVEVASRHHRPHFHAYYQDQVAIVAVDTIEALGGSLDVASEVGRGSRFGFHLPPLEHDPASPSSLSFG